jgi:predicted 3-demethylubiquinone-9 3-methyltransferase (glyoxalase superfamily)
MPRITPNLWFDTESEEAAEFYVSMCGRAASGRRLGAVAPPTGFEPVSPP